MSTTNGALYFDQLNIGDNWRSRGRTVTEADVMAFAGLTGDYDPLHVDAEFAGQSPYGERIAHGLLGISFLAGLNSNCPAVHTVSFIAIREWQFLKPIFFGDTVCGYAEIIDLKPNINRRGQVIWRRTLLNQRDEPVQSGIVDTLVALSPQPAATAPNQ
jgi:3-hydroxybutyryl-CoA dehydratase